MNTQQLEARSEIERSAVENTVGELRRRLSPGQLVDELLAYTNDGGGQFISNLGRQATDNPLPVTLIGAGLAWFLFSKGKSSGERTPSNCTSPMPGTTDRSSSTGTAESLSTVKDVGHNALNSVQDGLSAAMDSVSEGIGSAKSSLSSTSHAVKDEFGRATNSFGETAQAASVKASALKNSAVSFLKDQPLVILGAGLAFGAALGAGLPATEAENNLMGEASEGVKTQAKEAASDQLDKAKIVGENLYEEIKQEVRDGIAEMTHTHDGQATEAGYRSSSTPS